MDKSVRNKLVKLIITSGMLCIVTFCVAAVSFGWFSMNRTVTSSGMSIKTEGPTGTAVASYQAYRRDGKTNTAKLILDSDEEGFDTTNPRDSLTFEMTEYDTVFEDRNVDTPIVLRVVLDKVRTDSKGKGMPINVKIECPDNHKTRKMDGKDVMSEYMSNIIGIQYGNFPSLDSYSKDKAQDIYEGVRAKFDDTTTYPAKTFLTVSGNNLTKVTSISFTLSDYTLSGDKLFTYFQFNYDITNVSKYIDQHGIDVSTTQDGQSDMIFFNFDLTSLVFSYA